MNATVLAENIGIDLVGEAICVGAWLDDRDRLELVHIGREFLAQIGTHWVVVVRVTSQHRRELLGLRRRGIGSEDGGSLVGIGGDELLRLQQCLGDGRSRGTVIADQVASDAEDTAGAVRVFTVEIGGDLGQSVTVPSRTQPSGSPKVNAWISPFCNATDSTSADRPSIPRH